MLGKTPKNYIVVIIAFISGHRHLEDKKIMNRQHQVIVNHPETLAKFSVDVLCQTHQGRSMKQSDWDALEGTGSLKSMTVSNCRWGLLAWETTLNSQICQAGAPKAPHPVPLPTRILPCLSMESGTERKAKKGGDMMCREWLGRLQSGSPVPFALKMYRDI